MLPGKEYLIGLDQLAALTNKASYSLNVRLMSGDGVEAEVNYELNWTELNWTETLLIACKARANIKIYINGTKDSEIHLKTGNNGSRVVKVW